VVFYAYQQQLLASIEAINRPDITFRINAAFVGLNISANVLLVSIIGWVGAAVASALSTGVGLILSFRALKNHIDFRIPYIELLKQGTAALIMGIIVYAGNGFESKYYMINNNLATVSILIILGAGIYFAVLFAISTHFRMTVKQNLS
jgi:O-antigen/teichoic acid export membrane protein